MITKADLYRTAAGSVTALGIATALVTAGDQLRTPGDPVDTAIFTAASMIIVATAGLTAMRLVLRGRDRPRSAVVHQYRLSLVRRDVNSGFPALLLDALEDLPDVLRTALEDDVELIVAHGRPEAAYAVYRKGTLFISRDALVTDFGDDPDEMRDQVAASVRHALANGLDARALGVR